MNKATTSLLQLSGRFAVCTIGAALLVLAATNTARATVVTYSNPAAFQAAAPDAASYSFPYPTTNDFVDRPYVDGPLGFSTFDHFTHLFLENDWVYGAEFPYLSTVQPFGFAVTSAIEPQEFGTVFSLGFDLATRNGADIVSVSINFQPMQPFTSFTTPGGAPNTVFFGITDTDPIDQITFATSTGSEIDILDFYAGGAAVPEPSTWAMLGLGFVGASVVVLRRRRVV